MSRKTYTQFDELGRRELLKGPAVFLIPVGIMVAIVLYRELTDCGCAD